MVKQSCLLPERAGCKVNPHVAAPGTGLGLLGFAKDSYATSLILILKHVCDVQWAVQGVTESHGGLLADFHRGPLGVGGVP